MARRRFKAARRFAGRAARYVRRGIGGGQKQLIQADAIMYGAARPFISGFIAPYTSRIPGGSMADNIAMGLLDWFVAKRGGQLGKIATKGLIVENALAGADLVAMFRGNSQTGTSTSW